MIIPELDTLVTPVTNNVTKGDNEAVLSGFIKASNIDIADASLTATREYREKHSFRDFNEDSKLDSVDADLPYSTSDSEVCNKVLQQYTPEEPDQRQNIDSASNRKLIIDYLKTGEAHRSPKNIAKGTGINYNTVRSYLRRLVSEGVIADDEDHMYHLSNQLATLAGHRGAVGVVSARGGGIYAGGYLSYSQHFGDGGFRLQNIRVVGGVVGLSRAVSAIRVDVPYGGDVIHLVVRYSVRKGRFSWVARVAGGVHVDDLVAFSEFVSGVICASYIYLPPGELSARLVEARWFVRQVEVFRDDYSRRMSGYYEVDSLRGVICKEYPKGDCVRRENQLKRLPADTSVPDLVAAVHGSASEIDSNVRVKMLERQGREFHDSQVFLIQQVNDMRRDMDAVIRSNEAVLEALKRG